LFCFHFVFLGRDCEKTCAGPWYCLWSSSRCIVNWTTG